MPPNVADISDTTTTTTITSNGSVRLADDLLHPERFWVDYILEAESDYEARKLARGLCLEQTVELPDTIDAVKNVESYIVGSIERVELVVQAMPKKKASTNSLYRITVGYPNDTAGDELTQFLNVVFGNTSLKKGVAVENVTLSSHMNELTQLFPGPRFGIQGLRRILGVPQAPLLCTALKPMGRSSQEFADMAYHFAKGGIDIIKDDHGLASQV
jgi:ribulose-bisphosphate carboxylase large chain